MVLAVWIPFPFLFICLLSLSFFPPFSSFPLRIFSHRGFLSLLHPMLNFFPLLDFHPTQPVNHHQPILPLQPRTNTQMHDFENNELSQTFIYGGDFEPLATRALGKYHEESASETNIPLQKAFLSWIFNVIFLCSVGCLLSNLLKGKLPPKIIRPYFSMWYIWRNKIFILHLQLSLLTFGVGLHELSYKPPRIVPN